MNTNHTVPPSEELRLSEIRYRRLFEAARAGILILDAETRKITGVNPFMIELLGYSHDEFVGKELWEIGLLKDAETSTTAFQKLQESGYIRYEDLPLVTNHGLPCEVDFISNVYMEDGHRVIQCNIRDITKSARSEERRDRFFMLSLDLLAIAGLDGYFKRVNPAFSKVLGFTEEELQTQPYVDFVHPEDKVATDLASERTIHGQTTTSFQNRYRTKAGAWRWLDWKSVVVPEEGLIYATARDVTDNKEIEIELRRLHDQLELKVIQRTAELSLSNIKLQSEVVERQRAEASLYKSHEFLQSVLENTAEGIVACDADGQLTLFNRASRDFHGLPVAPLSVDQWVNYYSLYMADGVTPMQQQDVPLFKALNGEHVRNMEMVIAPKHSNSRILIANGEPLFDADGGKLGAVVVLHDITERKRTELELHRAKHEADVANLAKSEFLSRMSHELRTPLNAILGFGQILENEQLTVLQKESVGYVLKGGRHLLNLIDEVLDIARLEAGRVDLSIEPVALDDVIPEACAMIKHLAAERQIQIELDFSKLEHIHVLADHQRLKLVFVNLLTNAIKYNKVGGQVFITCTLIPNEQICISIRDTGPGVAPDDLAKLFTPFERLRAVNSEVEGTGLGLVLSLRLMTSMGGTLEVGSICGQGTTFNIRLPQVTSTKYTSEDLVEFSSEKSVVSSNQQTYSVLCIEDNSSNLRLLEIILTSRPSVTMLTAMEGGSGLELARKHKPNLILLDLHLPDMSGQDVLTNLRSAALTKDIPVVIVSADATALQIHQLITAGATAYLIKPLNVTEFLRTLDVILQATPFPKAGVDELSDGAEEVSVVPTES